MAVKHIDNKKKKKNARPEPTDPSKSDISGLSAESLETAVKQDENPAAGEFENASPGQANTEKTVETPAAKPKKKKLSDQDKSRLMGAAATVVCVGCLAVFVIYQMFSGMLQTPSQNDPQNPDHTTAPVVNIPGQASQDGVELEIQTGQNDNDIIDNPFNRGQWDDYKLETENGDQAAENRGSQVDSGTRYWLRARDGSNMYKIVIPSGYVAADLGDCVTVGTGNYEATGSEPVTFFWRKGSDIRSLLDNGYKNLMGNATGYDQYDVRALGYYLFRDESGDTWPVVTAVMTRDESNPDIETYQEYWIVVGKPASDNRYLVGTIPAESFSDLATQLCPNISAFAKALFPADSIPDFPDNWSIPSNTGPVTGTDSDDLNQNQDANPVNTEPVQAPVESQLPDQIQDPTSEPAQDQQP